MATLNLYAGNNTLDVELLGLVTRSTGAPITDATVEATINDVNGAPVSGVSWPVNMPHVSGGDYLGVVSHDSNIVAGKKYEVVVLAVDQAGNRGEFIETVKATLREFP